MVKMKPEVEEWRGDPRSCAMTPRDPGAPLSF